MLPSLAEGGLPIEEHPLRATRGKTGWGGLLNDSLLHGTFQHALDIQK